MNKPLGTALSRAHNELLRAGYDDDRAKLKRIEAELSPRYWRGARHIYQTGQYARTMGQECPTTEMEKKL